MGLLTAELPSGGVHQWLGRDSRMITAFLERFRGKALQFLAQDPGMRRVIDRTGCAPDQLWEDWLFGMAKHVLTSPPSSSEEVRQWRDMFLTYLLLQYRDPQTGQPLSELLPNNDIMFRDFSVGDRGIEYSMAVVSVDGVA